MTYFIYAGTQEEAIVAGRKLQSVGKNPGFKVIHELDRFRGCRDAVVFCIGTYRYRKDFNEFRMLCRHMNVLQLQVEDISQ